jgi:hypothetical protein
MVNIQLAVYLLSDLDDLTTLLCRNLKSTEYDGILYF